MIDLFPGGKSDTDRRFGIVNPAVYLPVFFPEIKRAVVQWTTVRIHPVRNVDNSREIIKGDLRDIPPSALPAIAKPDCHVPEDIKAPGNDPGNKVFNDPFLVPPPLLAACAALPAVLVAAIHGIHFGNMGRNGY